MYLKLRDVWFVEEAFKWAGQLCAYMAFKGG